MENQELREWWQDGLVLNATHLLVVFDVRTFTSTPIYVLPEESVISKITSYEKSESHLIVELFSYAESFELQLLLKRRDDYS